MDAIVERLRQVGFSLDEARVYAALRRCGSHGIGFDEWDRRWQADPALDRRSGRNADVRTAVRVGGGR
jgi:hypothetical protein